MVYMIIVKWDGDDRDNSAVVFGPYTQQPSEEEAERQRQAVIAWQDNTGTEWEDGYDAVITCLLDPASGEPVQEEAHA